MTGLPIILQAFYNFASVLNILLAMLVDGDKNSLEVYYLHAKL